MASSPASEPLQRGWWLEDAVPGVTLRHAGGRTVDEAEHVWLAWITDNVSDVHGNADGASRGAFGRPVVLGALTAAIVIGLASPATGGPATAASASPIRWGSIRLPSPVVAGDTIRAESLIHEASAPDGRTGCGLVHRTITGRNQRGEVVATIEEERAVPTRALVGEHA